MSEFALGFAGASLFLVAVGIVGLIQQRRRAARWSQRAHQSDAIFLTESGIPQDGFESRLVLTARRTLGILKRVPPETIHADDAVRGDFEKITDDWECLDWLDMVYRIQRQLQVAVDQHRLWALARESAYLCDRPLQICDAMQALISATQIN